MKIIYIEWCEAISYDDYKTKSDALEWAVTDNWIIKEVGYLLFENDKYMLLATRQSKCGDAEIEYGGLMKIPKTWIIKRKELNL